MPVTAGQSDNARILVVGAPGSGKTSLIRRLLDLGAPVTKTQALEFYDFAVDTPGEYVQIPRLFFAVLSQVGDARGVWVVQDATAARPTVPPGFAYAFRDRAVGIITKIDSPQADLPRAERFLAGAGVPGPYLRVSVVTGEGVDRVACLADRRKT
ncbi:MAG: ethanolamine utilization protein EutP [Firmicutes bacterium]|nr:ethanolamine utilization protein EutP [Bacillota bacterium]